MSELTERIAGLSPEKRELLTRLLQKEGVKISGLAITRRPDPQAPAPLSFAQQRLWFLDQLEPGSSFYNIFDTCSFNEPLDIGALERAINEIVRRHEVLRTSFTVVDGEPVQEIARVMTVSLPVIDLGHLSLDEKEIEAARLSAEEAGTPFDLNRGPLVRFKLLRLHPQEHVLFLSMHHIISDGWSLDILHRELQELYEAFARGEDSPLAELPVQYADFAIWQRHWLQGEELEAQLSYWVEQLSGAPAALELPTDRQRPLMPTHNGASQTRALSAALSDSLSSLSRSENVTPFITALAAFNVLLHRYANQDDLVVGTPVAGRGRAETEDMIGFFVNTLVVRTNLSGDPTFKELLGRVKAVALGAYRHQDVPFEKLVEVIHPERDTSRNPLFQVSFQLTDIPDAPNDYDGQGEDNSDGSEVAEAPAKFDLGINIWRSPTGLRLQADYSTDLFEHATIARMLKHFETLIRNIVADPDRRISELTLLADAERSQLLHEWNDTATHYPRHSCLPQLFEAQVERTPDAVALLLGVTSLTYDELNKRANRVARSLRKVGVRPEVGVGICMERSIEMIVGLLGILKAGGAYLPLDPEYPEQRLRFMIEDAGVRVLLTQARFAEILSPDCERIICLDSDWESIAEESGDNLDSGATAQNPAHVIYTSGSTGKPKGVVITHAAVARTVCDTNYISLETHDRIAQASNASFDAATFEIWTALVHGATLVIVSKEILLSPKALAHLIREFAISVLFLPTALFNQIAAEDPSAFSSVRYLLFGGEMVDPRWVRDVLNSDAPAHLLHMYGPTESTTYATWYAVKSVSAEASTVPIGRPVSNTEIYLLDRYLQPVPVGVAGEIYVGGHGLARGYLGRPSLTAERFMPNPFSASPGSRVYRTGDVARYLAGGELEFLGRRDEQVKVRGYRIELGEIEANLREHPEVRETVVLVREDIPGQKRIVAYVVAETEFGLQASALRTYMRERVPDYMLPSAFILVQQIPITPNGKVDRRALPGLEHARLEEDGAFVSPRTPVEEALTRIFAAVLGLASVGVNDNFFDLGGHSLLATQIISRIRETFQIELPLRALFSGPTVVELCAMVEEARKTQTEPHSPTINRVSREQYRARMSSAGVLEVSEALKRSMQMAKA